MYQAFKLTLLISLGICSARATKDACDPECVKADTFIADPYSCNGYYYCISPGTPSGVYYCPENKIFDANVHPNHVTPAEPCKASAPCNPKCDIPECQVICRDTFDTIVDTANCGNFYLCIENGDGTFTEHPDTCPSDRPYFNGHECSSHLDDCCNVCDPSCKGEEYGVIIPDPYECHNYYTCLGDDLMTEDSTACLGSGHFDIALGKCVAGNNCTNLCDKTTTTVSSSSLSEYLYDDY